MYLVTITEAMRHLNFTYPGEEEPPELELYIAAASAGIINYLGDDATFLEADSGSDGQSSIPPEVKAACLIWVGEMFAEREGKQVAPIDPRFGYGYPPAAVVSLLAPLRCPRMA